MMAIRARDGRLICEADGIADGTLNCADLYSRDLTEADLAGVVMEGVMMNDAILVRATLRGADLYEAYLFPDGTSARPIYARPVCGGRPWSRRASAVPTSGTPT